VELAAFALVLAGVVLVVCREVLKSSRRLRGAPPAIAVAVLCGFLLAAPFRAAAEGDAKKEAAPRAAAVKPAVKKLVKPKDWPADHPLPLVGSNCAACHLTAGRELTAAVVNFVRSVHDLQEMTCYDCHGGNTTDDVKAHEEAFGFIGTKKSAHIAGCADCHTEEAEALAAGPHHWDFSQRINTEYPMCFDCHGNHDIGNPPADFKLAAMCGDCHEDMDKEFPNLAAVVRANDRLWQTMGQVRRKRIAEATPLPEAFTEPVAQLRHDTMMLVHASREIPADKADDLNKQAEALRSQMQKWLQSAK
jgi:formate-dependent nitrite reductase cytochrome c552 subunit